jgi:phosphotransferase system  glucose/maltose/N-acetylglucosamine-specific IIC component
VKNDTLKTRLVAVVMALVAVWLAYVTYVNAIDFYSRSVTELLRFSVLRIQQMQLSFVVPGTVAFLLFVGVGYLWYYSVPEHERYLRSHRR